MCGIKLYFKCNADTVVCVLIIMILMMMSITIMHVFVCVCVFDWTLFVILMGKSLCSSGSCSSVK